MMELKHGHCLCGQVTYEYSGPELRCGHCHCESCRRCTSSPFTTFFEIALENFSFTGREPKCYESSPGTRRLFCGDCGSPMGFMAERYPGKIHLYAVSQENPDNFHPEYHGHVDEKLPWITIDDDMPQYGHSGGANPGGLNSKTSEA